jgi:DNA adenine methylase
MLDEPAHVALADALHATAASVLISGYHSPLYDELYAGWPCREIKASAGVGNGDERARLEVVWSNREFPHEQGDLFDE